MTEERRGCWPSVLVGAFVLGIAVLESIVPKIAGAIAAVLS